MLRNCAFFEQTGHTVCEPFLSYWRNNGLEFDGQPGKSYDKSLALFGMPLSEPMMETNSSGFTVLTQWYERARFESLPDKPDPYKVLLGRLGAEVYDPNAIIGDERLEMGAPSFPIAHLSSPIPVGGTGTPANPPRRTAGAGARTRDARALPQPTNANSGPVRGRRNYAATGPLPPHTVLQCAVASTPATSGAGLAGRVVLAHCPARAVVSW
jgi:hypothetical protein